MNTGTVNLNSMNSTSKDNPMSVKARLTELEAYARNLNDEILQGIQEIEDFREEMKDILESERDGPEQIRGEVSMEARKLDEQIKKHFSHQRAENNRMQADQNE